MVAVLLVGAIKAMMAGHYDGRLPLCLAFDLIFFGRMGNAEFCTVQMCQ